MAGENLYGLSYAQLNYSNRYELEGAIYGWHGPGAIGLIGLAKKIWIPLVIVLVVAVAGFTVHRVRTFFGADGIIVTPKVFADDPEPFDPKVVKYEIFGSGSYADINYLDLDAKPQRIDGAGLPWSLTLQTTAPSAAPNIVAQGDGSSITCRITVDDEIKDERTSNGLNAQTFCFVKSA